MRKPNLTTDTVAGTDVSQSSLGVRTRAKTLALQKLQASNSTAVPPPSPAAEPSYLQLRSRRLEKLPVKELTWCRQRNPNPNFVSCSGGSVGSGLIENRVETEECFYFGGEEASFGDNNIEFNGRERTRESTPCSLTHDLNVINTPGSSTRPRVLEASNRIPQNSVTRSMPLAQEIEEFFACHEREQQRRFADKYNFDITNENPLEGCYEWVKVQSR